MACPLRCFWKSTRPAGELQPRGGNPGWIVFDYGSVPLLTLVLSGIAALGRLLVAIPAFKTSLVHNGSS